MEAVAELEELASLVRSGADVILAAVEASPEAGQDDPTDLQKVELAKAELAVAFQCLARAAHALDLDQPTGAP